MDKNEREEWIHDLATAYVNRTSKAGQFAFAVCHATRFLEAKDDEELKEIEESLAKYFAKDKKPQKKKTKGGGF